MKMSFMEAIIMSGMDAICYLIISSTLIGRKLFTLRRGFQFLFLTGVAGTIGYYLQDEISFLFNIFVVLITFLFYKIKLEKTVYIYIISTVAILVVQFALLIPTQLIFSDGIQYDFYTGLFPQTATILIVVLLARFVPIHLFYEYVVTDNKIFKWIFLNTFLLLAFGVVYWSVDFNGVLENLISVLVISLVLVFANFVILENGLRNKHEQQQLQIYEKYMLIIDEIISELRRKQHEYDNHIQALSMIPITYGECSVVQEKIESYYTDLKAKNELVDFLKLDNKILAGFLYAKFKQAMYAKIHLNIKIKNYSFDTKVKDYELIEMIGIVIDNAIEASGNNAEVDVLLDQKGKKNIIQVKNKHPYISQEQMNNFFKKGMSTKGNGKRGYGLYNLARLMKKYTGDIIVSNQTISNQNYVVFTIELS